MRLGDLLGVLRDAYCRTIGVEYMHIQDTDEQQWIQDQVEQRHEPMPKERKHRILERLNAAESFEKFLATKYVGTKRFGIEGAESAIPILDEILSNAADADFDSAVLGMAHRGRLNVLSNIMGKSYEAIFSEFEGHIDPSSVQGSGDVKYHLGMKGKHVSPSGADVAIELAANPSHLETVGPIVMGMVRAQQDQIEPAGAFNVLPVLIHGDAAFAGQGIVAEGLAMSDIGGYRIGGTIHLIINNQIGFTTAPQYARSSLYCSDVAKTIQAPIFHVNGDDPEACVRVAEVAWEYRQTFHKDVVIDMVCYRRHGHNEGDDPSYTQPLMYRAISERRSVRKLYVETLVKHGDITLEEAEQALVDFHDKLQVSLDQTRSSAPATTKAARPPQPLGVLPHIETGVERATLDRIFAKLTDYPEGFTIHPKLAKQFVAALYQEGSSTGPPARPWRWARLCWKGTPSGWPARTAGTFSQRHATLIDYQTGEPWIPLDNLDGAEAHFWVFDSLLSEYAAMGFEYGYSHANPEALVMWEAQFGDFVNGAQIVIDQYIVAAEDKWGQPERSGAACSPHGYGEAGPGAPLHHIERFLTLGAEDNMQIVNATTAANYFPPAPSAGALDAPDAAHRVHAEAGAAPHEEQHPGSTSRRADARLVPGKLLDDPGDPRTPTRSPASCSARAKWPGTGDWAARDERQRSSVAIVRVEQLYPLPTAADADDPQEVPERRASCDGSRRSRRTWVRGRFIERPTRLADQRGAGLYDIEHVARVESGSPATGSKTVHDQELADLMERTFS